MILKVWFKNLFETMKLVIRTLTFGRWSVVYPELPQNIPGETDEEPQKLLPAGIGGTEAGWQDQVSR